MLLLLQMAGFSAAYWRKALRICGIFRAASARSENLRLPPWARTRFSLFARSIAALAILTHVYFSIQFPFCAEKGSLSGPRVIGFCF